MIDWSKCDTNCLIAPNDRILHAHYCPNLKENQMSDKPNPPRKATDFDLSQVKPENIKQAAEDLLKEQSPEVQQAVEKSKSFYMQNRPIILTGVTVLVIMKVNKRMVKKATVKAVAKALKNSGEFVETGSHAPTIVEIARELRDLPDMRYVAPGGGAVHALLNNDIVITLIRDGVEKMNNFEIDRAIREAWYRRDF